MKANVAWSTEEDVKIAGKNIAKKAVLDLDETKIAFLFSSVKYNTKKLLEGTKEIMGTAPIIGCTSSGGVVVPDGYISSQNGFAGMMAIGKDEELFVSTAAVEKDRIVRVTGRKAAENALKKAKKHGRCDRPSYVYVIATPGDEEEYIMGIQDVLGDIPCFGGSMADENMSGRWRLYNEEKIVEDGVVIALFYTGKEITNILDGRYHETVYSGTIKETSGRRNVVKIDGVKSLKKYLEWTNQEFNDVRGMKMSHASILKPLGIKTVNSDTTLIRHPLNGNTDYTMNIGNDVCVNTTLVQMEISKDELIDSPRLVLRRLNNKKIGKAKAYIIMHSASRKKLMEGRLDETARKIKQEIGDVPFIMPFSYGEYGRGNNTGNLCGGLMISATAICE
jgi:hypothetical protein